MNNYITLRLVSECKHANVTATCDQTYCSLSIVSISVTKIVANNINDDTHRLYSQLL